MKKNINKKSHLRRSKLTTTQKKTERKRVRASDYPKQTQITEKEKKTHYETILNAYARSVQ